MARLLDSSGTTIKVSPSTRRVVVSVYLEADTYTPVIAVLRPSEPESPDTKPTLAAEEVVAAAAAHNQER